ncbi:MAG TPA: transglycosylase SLT domain-containing protein [Polyangia bacterium]|nr:transglycosylase SLT domain-containing protein [Polyangia bacterium]
MAISTLGVCIALAAATTAPAARGPVADLARGFLALRAGEYHESARALDGLAARLPRNRDYALYLLGESLFYDGSYAKARAAFSELAKLRPSRFAGIAAWRAADCQWMQGQRGEAAVAYRRLLAGKTPGTDPVVARFRLAEFSAEGTASKGGAAAQDARRLYLQVHLDFPSHPLAVEAAKRAAMLGAPTAAARAPAALSPHERLRRAEKLADGREYQAALDELALLPAALPADLAAERDFATGMAKYNMRRDYAGAAALLQKVAPALVGEKAAFAAFHGARALSRIERNDEAIAGYRQVVERYPTSKWAAEAQFRSGWLEVNRGRFREALPGLQATLVRYPHSPFADDAAWYLALAHHLLGEPAEALRALEHYEHLSHNNNDVAMRVRYWRARFAAQAGLVDEAQRSLRECVHRSPLGYYGLLAAARLREAGEKVAVDWPVFPSPAPADKAKPARDPALERARELLAAGLDVEAGEELGRGEAGVLQHMGTAHGLAVLLEEYPRMRAFRRALRLAESHGASALAAAATGPARLYWQAAYPRAFRDMVEPLASTAGAPELFVYAIMRKESSFLPHALSPSDARGLLQLIPATGQEVAKHLGVPLFTDELFDPEVNIRVGAAYLGGLLKRFGQQIALAAGAYNAGSHAMMRWCDQWGSRPLDEFVELVTYDQAREYIKRVLAVYAHYRWLYGEPFELSLAVNPHYSSDGIND